jgi:Phosphodiester glycosidase
VLRKAVLVVALAALVLPSLAAGARSSEKIMPGVTYIRDRHVAYGAPVVFHVALGAKPGGLYALRPVLSNRHLTGRETVSTMQRHFLSRANLIGVNGDFTNVIGYPSGIFMAGGILAGRPARARSSLGISTDGSLQIGRILYVGTFRAGEHASRRLREFNRPLHATHGFALFVPSWGARTPPTPRTNEAILTGVERTFPNRDRSAQVVRLVRGSGHTIPAGGAILQARGVSRAVLRAEAKPGTPIAFRLGLDPWWSGVRSAIGGGPELVRNGVAILHAGESFSSYQLAPRHPHTAVGQLADGRILLVAVDGRSRASAGLSISQLAREMVRLGAVNAMSLDGGGSTTMAFNGKVLNRPSDGHERAVGDSLHLIYIGAYARKPRFKTFSPNGDGYADVQRLYAKFVRASDVHLRLIRPDGTVRWEYRAFRSPGTITHDLSGRLREGRWRWIISGVDRNGRASSMQRRFRINNTLGFVTLSKPVMRVRRRIGGHLRIGFRLAHRADATVTIRRRDGSLVRRLVSQTGLAPGGYAVIWNGKRDSGRVVRSGAFFAVVRAVNGLGPVAVRKKVVVRRVT